MATTVLAYGEVYAICFNKQQVDKAYWNLRSSGWYKPCDITMRENTAEDLTNFKPENGFVVQAYLTSDSYHRGNHD